MRYGEIVELGRHMLMCGDATNRDDVMSLVNDETVILVLTDPPYGMEVQKNTGCIGGKHHTAQLRCIITLEARKYPKMVGDDSQESLKKHYEIAKTISKKFIIWGGQYFANILPVNRGWLFWNKRTGNNDFSDGELAYTNIGKRVRMYTQLWNGICMEGSYTLNGRDKTARIHPTQKPVELHMKILEDFSKPDDVVLDCFGGSGTTLIACEMTGRKCLMMEISPEYCDVIRRRYEKLTEGKLPLEVVHER